jgi:hypothetical protein
VVHLPDFAPDHIARDQARFASMVDPLHYVREADLAVLNGRREAAMALIAKAYLAFDLVAVDCD